jgi:hypothetical protein
MSRRSSMVIQRMCSLSFQLTRGLRQDAISACHHLDSQ